jgi:ABC-type glycerol-3-phosphate transport system substrate-binding protein
MDVTGNPIIITAADVTALAAVAGSGNNPGDIINIGGTLYLVVWRGALHVYQVEFQDYLANADKALIYRYNGKVFCDLHGGADLQTVRSGNAGWTNNGLIIPNNGINNGNVRIYIK